MKQNPRSLMHARYLPVRWSATLLLLIAFLLNGCSARRSPGISWANAVQVKPMLPATALASNDSTADPPVFNLNVSPVATILVPVHTVPLRPRSGAAAPTNAATDPEKPEGPKIALQLSPEQTVAARQETNQSLDIAEKNLAVTRGKTLNAAEADLVSKIKGFLKDAREAAHAKDWARARSLAKKAQVLSEQLAESL